MTLQDQNDRVATDVSMMMYVLLKQRAPAVENLNKDTPLDEIGLDSFDMIEFIFSIEEKYDIEISFSTNSKEPSFKTIGEVVEKVVELVEQKNLKNSKA